MRFREVIDRVHLQCARAHLFSVFQEPLDRSSGTSVKIERQK